jgi:porin
MTAGEMQIVSLRPRRCARRVTALAFGLATPGSRTWYDSDSFDDLQYDDQGVPLASPASSGIPASRRGNHAIYGVLSQMIWRSKDSNRTISVFVRPMFAPLEDRNLINFSVNAGLTVKAPIAGRGDDTFSLGTGIARVSDSASDYDRDLEFYEPTVLTPVRGTETFLEATCQIQATKWLQIRPGIQYVLNPGAGLANPNDPTQRIKNERVVGQRSDANGDEPDDAHRRGERKNLEE